MEYMTLMGAEQVQSAANTMRGAADEMRRAASDISWALEAHQRFLQDWLYQFQTTIKPVSAPPDGGREDRK